MSASSLHRESTDSLIYAAAKHITWCPPNFKGEGQENSGGVGEGLP